MGTGPPAFTEVDNPASFEENVFLRVSKIIFRGLFNLPCNSNLTKV